MQIVSQTLIGTVRSEVEDWRKENGWSRETVAQLVVEAHERIGADKVTGVTFDPPSRDAVARMKTNADRLYRWLDDVTKECTLLPSNVLPSVLAALPIDRRLNVLNTILRPLGVDARSSDDVEGADTNVNAHLKAVAKESTEAVIALHEVSPDAPQVVLEAALKEVEEAQEATTRAARGIKALLARGMSRLRAA